MKGRIGICVLVGMAFALVRPVNAANENKKGFKADCVMSGKPAKENCSTDIEGKKVYFCCGKCLKGFKEDPDKAKAHMYLQFLQTGQMVQVGCPFSGKPVKKKTLVKFKGTEFGFCCNKCKSKFEEADDSKKLEMVFASIAKGFTLQTNCPISGKPIDPETSTTYKGQTLYFCCPGCEGKFKKDPEKYMAKLKPKKAKS